MEKYKKYTKKDFERFCEDYFLDEWSDRLWSFIKGEEVILDFINLDEKQTEKEAELIVKIKLHED